MLPSSEFTGDKTLSGVTTRKKTGAETLELPVNVAFLAVGLEPNSSMAAPLVKHKERREIIINPDCSTSHPGIFAAVEVTDTLGNRIIIASGEGVKAALVARPERGLAGSYRQAHSKRHQHRHRGLRSRAGNGL